MQITLTRLDKIDGEENEITTEDIEEVNYYISIWAKVSPKKLKGATKLKFIAITNENQNYNGEINLTYEDACKSNFFQNHILETCDFVLNYPERFNETQINGAKFWVKKITPLVVDRSFKGKLVI